MKTIITLLVAVAALSACSSLGGNNQRQFAREKQACAELGLDPASPAGNQCALDLDATMFEIDTAR